MCPRFFYFFLSVSTKVDKVSRIKLFLLNQIFIKYCSSYVNLFSTCIRILTYLEFIELEAPKIHNHFQDNVDIFTSTAISRC